jgi:hypothetical protein
MMGSMPCFASATLLTAVGTVREACGVLRLKLSPPPLDWQG